MSAVSGALRGRERPGRVALLGWVVLLAGAVVLLLAPQIFTAFALSQILTHQRSN